ncbi:MAG: hypothetical protein ABI311_13815 [Gemmatimonadaceae bacterium]
MKAEIGRRGNKAETKGGGYEGGAIRFTGTPRNLRAQLSVSVERAQAVPVVLTIEGSVRIHRAVWRARSSSTSELVLRLPAATGAGEYMGEATVDGKRQAVAVSIGAQPCLTVFPDKTLISAVSGASETFTLTVANCGNVSVMLPADAAIDLDDNDAQDHALGRSLRAKLTANERRVDRFFEELREGHGGEAHIVVTRGSGELRPGDSRELVCVFHVPNAVQAGRQYGGAWGLGMVSHGIVVNAKGSDANTTSAHGSHEPR